MTLNIHHMLQLLQIACFKHINMISIQTKGCNLCKDHHCSILYMHKMPITHILSFIVELDHYESFMHIHYEHLSLNNLPNVEYVTSLMFARNGIV